MVGGSTRGRKSRAPKKPGTRGRGRPSATKDGRSRPPSIAECFLFRCTEVLDRLKKKDHYNIFLKPVNPDQVAGYRDVVKNPMDFSTMGKKLQEQQYKSLGEFRRDLDLIWSNCLFFNGAEPNNVFSKKAIELRKVTEKLIASTRSSLEKDKEELHRWKERHRRQREERTGLVPDAVAGVTASARMGANMAIALPGAQASDVPALDSPLPPSSANPQQLSPEEALQLALKQLLRVQYGSNTGLYRTDHQESLPQHYIAPDGSAVRIPSVRYNPGHPHWEDFDFPTRLPKRKLELSNALYNRLDEGLRPNYCHPGMPVAYVRVKDFVDSVRAFVGNSGAIPNRIVDEFLAPELAIRDAQESRKRRKLEPVLNRPKSQSLSAVLDSNSNPLTRDDAANLASHASSTNAQKLAASDPLMSSCKVSVFPNAARKIAELDGEAGLAHLLGPGLTEEVQNVPVSVVDFAMPYGLNPETLTDLLRLAMHPGLGINPTHVNALNEVCRNTVEVASKMNPQLRAAHGGASLLSAQEIHDTQISFSRQAEALSKSISRKQSQLNAQRKHEAQVISESMRKRQESTIHRALNAAGDQLPPIISASAQSMLSVEHQNPLIERKLHDQNAKSRARAENSVNSFQARNPIPTGPLRASGGPTPSTGPRAHVIGHTAPVQTRAPSSSAMHNVFMKITSGQMPPIRGSMHMGNLSGSTGNILPGSASINGTAANSNTLAFRENGRRVISNPSFPAGGQGAQNSAGSSRPGHYSSVGLSAGVPGAAPSRVICSNCGCVCVQGWRLGGPSGKEQLCSPCGLHWERTKTHRAKASLPEPVSRVVRASHTAATGVPKATTGRATMPKTTELCAPGAMRFAPAPQNGNVGSSGNQAIYSSLMNTGKNVQGASAQSVGVSHGNFRGVRIPLSQTMNSVHGNQHVVSQIGNEIDSFSLPGLPGENPMQQRAAQGNNAQKFSPVTSAAVVSSARPSPSGARMLPSNNLLRLNARTSGPSSIRTPHLAGQQFSQSPLTGVDQATLNSRLGRQAQQGAASGQSQAFNLSHSHALGLNPLSGLPQFMTENGSGLPRPPNSEGIASSVGLGSVGRALQGQALRPPPRDNVDPFSSTDQQSSSVHNFGSDMSLPPLVPLPFEPRSGGNNGQPNHEGNEASGSKANSQNTAAHIDNLFLDTDFGF